MIRAALREKIRIIYTAKRLTTGLTDVKIDIYRPNGTKIIDQVTCSELANGIYYYDWTPPNTGNFIAIFDSASQPNQDSQSINVFGRSTVFGQVLRPTGGGVRVVQKSPWTKNEKEEVLKAIQTLFTLEFPDYRPDLVLLGLKLKKLAKQIEILKNRKLVKIENKKIEIPKIEIPNYANDFGKLKTQLENVSGTVGTMKKLIENYQKEPEAKEKPEEILNAIQKIKKVDITPVKARIDSLSEEINTIGKILTAMLSNKQLEETL